MEKRKPLTRLQFARLALEQEGKCACCGERLDFHKPRQIVDEHVQPLFSAGSNEMDNRQLWCVTCATEKTRKEAPSRAKVRRFEGKKTQADKRKAAGGSRIKSRGFQPPPAGYKYKWSNK